MSGDIVPQVDVGSLTLRGLNTFAPLLAALSTDDVAPLAMIQLEQLGSLFHINGKYAAKVPTLLQRTASTRLDRLGIAVGWRKGDAPSFMAQSAGGLAVSMLCFCLKNIYKDGGCGSILSNLCEKILPRKLSVCSMAQLVNVATLLASKLSALGFGNILAEQVVRIHDAYKALGTPVPSDFFQPITAESTVDLLLALTKVFSEQDRLVRVTGTYAMGHIMAIVLIMFPEDVTLTVDAFIIQEGIRRSIILEIDSSLTSPSTTVQVECKLKLTALETLPLKVDKDVVRESDSLYTFAWPGHIADALQLSFTSVGLDCPQDLLAACCDFLTLVMPWASRDPVKKDGELPSNGFHALLGQEPTQHVYRVCREVFRAVPAGQALDIAEALYNIARVFDATVDVRHLCGCRTARPCDRTKGWESFQKRAQSVSAACCVPRMLWRHVGTAIERGLFSFLIDAEANATIAYDGNYLYSFREAATGLPEINRPLSLCDIHSRMISFFARRTDLEDALAISDGSSTIYPSCLVHVRSNIDVGYRYELRDGCLIFQGRHYRELRSASARDRSRPLRSLRNDSILIRPNPAGEHSNLLFTVRETPAFLELRTTISAQGRNINVNFANIAIASLGLEDAGACDHNLHGTLAVSSMPDVCTTSVASPLAPRESPVSIVQTRGNETAQLLACVLGHRTILQRNCCLNCALAQARIIKASVIIVGI